MILFFFLLGSCLFDEPFVRPRSDLSQLLQVTPHARQTISDEEVEQLVYSLNEVDKETFSSVKELSNYWHQLDVPYPLDFSFPEQELSQIQVKLRTLVSLGPEAIPCLLRHIDAESRTDWSVKSKIITGFRTGRTLFFYDNTWGNPVNPIESAATIQMRGPVFDGHENAALYARDNIGRYDVKLGDICYIALGKIVNRKYQTFWRNGGSDYGVTSPVADPKLAQTLRTIWGADTANSLLYKSLIADFNTSGLESGKRLSGYNFASATQIGAMQRMIAFYPDELKPLVLDQINALIADAQKVNQIGKNADLELRVVDLIEAFENVQDPVMRSAIDRLGSDPAIRSAIDRLGSSIAR